MTPTISVFFENKSIFITGGGGFIGKVLIEKLLRSCSDLKTIYLLLRAKKGMTPKERLKKLTDVPLFDVVRSQDPGCLKKLKVVIGDVAELGLGLDPEDREVLVREVNVIFHGAASVGVDDSLRDAVFINTRGTREVVALALEIKSLDVLVHVSTTYCNTDKNVVEEKLYPPHGDWRKTIEIAEKIDRNVLNAFTEKYISICAKEEFPRSSTDRLWVSVQFSLVLTHFEVVPSYDEPVHGWIDSLNGPLAIAAAYATGVMRVIYCNPENTVDYVPVDLVVKSRIISAWKQGTFQDDNLKKTLNVYNGSNCGLVVLKQEDVQNCLDKIKKFAPIDKVLWYPRCTHTQSFLIFYLQMVFYQLIPAVIFDVILKILGKKPLLMKMQRKIYTAHLALSFYMHNEWTFSNKKCLDLDKHLAPSDVKSFYLAAEDTDSDKSIASIAVGLKKYILKEDNDFEKCKKKLNRLKIAAVAFIILLYLLLFWLLFVKFDVISLINEAGKNYWAHLVK